MRLVLAIRPRSFRPHNHSLKNARFSGALSDRDDSNRYSPANQVKIYGELSKATLSSMVVITAGAGYCAYGGEFSMLTCTNLCAGTAFAAATAAIVNQVIEVRSETNFDF
jgi:heme O synthase-like polyprenyltransferase